MPPLAIDAIRREVSLLGERVREHLDLAMAAIFSGRPVDVGSVETRERLLDKHHAQIVHYAEHLLQQELARETGLVAINLVEAADYLEALGDLVEKELIPIYERQRARYWIRSRSSGGWSEPYSISNSRRAMPTPGFA